MPAPTLASGHQALTSGPTGRLVRSLISSDTFSRTDPGAWPFQVPSSEASSPLPEDQPTPDAQGPKGNSHHSPTRQSFFFPAAAAEKAKPHGPPPPASGPRFTGRPEPPALPSATPFPSRRFPPRRRPSPGAGRLPSPASRGPGSSRGGPGPRPACRTLTAER